MKTLDRKALVHMVKTIKVISKTELDIDFSYVSVSANSGSKFYNVI